MSNPNANVRLFTGPINAAAYWIGDHLLRAGDVVNDSTVTGTTVKAALNTLSAASSAVFPFTASGLAEQDLVSYDAGAATWRNRTKEAALKGAGTTSFNVGTGSFAPGTNDITLGTSAGNSAATGNNNIAIGTDALDAAVNVSNVVAIGRNALSSALTFVAGGSVGIGQNAYTSLISGRGTAVGRNSQTNVTTGSNQSFGMDSMYAAGASATANCAFGDSALGQVTSQENCGFGNSAGVSITSGARNCLFGASTNSSATADDNTFIGYGVSPNPGSRNSAVGSQAFNSSFSVTDCVAFGYNALTGVISSTGPSGTVAIGSTALQAITTGVNTAIGFAAGLTLTTGTNNTIVGYSADVTAVSRSGCVIIGRGASGAADDTLVIRMGNTSTKELTITPVTDATARVANTYLPIQVGATQYYLPLYV